MKFLFFESPTGFEESDFINSFIFSNFFIFDIFWGWLLWLVHFWHFCIDYCDLFIFVSCSFLHLVLGSFCILFIFVTCSFLHLVHFCILCIFASCSFSYLFFILFIYATFFVNWFDVFILMCSSSTLWILSAKSVKPCD